MKDAKQHLRSCLGYEVYNQATGDARKTAGLLGFPKKETQWKAADLSQPTLGAPINVDVVICGMPFDFSLQDDNKSNWFMIWNYILRAFFSPAQAYVTAFYDWHKDSSCSTLQSHLTSEPFITRTEDSSADLFLTKSMKDEQNAKRTFQQWLDLSLSAWQIRQELACLHLFWSFCCAAKLAH